jgi:hypothetical protein
MRLKSLAGVMFLFAAVAFSYDTANAQVVDAAKDAASKTKDVSVDTAKKTSIVVTDGLDKTKDMTADSAKNAGANVKKIGSYSIETTENIKVVKFEDGKWFTVTKWDGTKWVSKRTWFANKKAADAVAGDEVKKP